MLLLLARLLYTWPGRRVASPERARSGCLALPLKQDPLEIE